MKNYGKEKLSPCRKLGKRNKGEIKKDMCNKPKELPDAKYFKQHQIRYRFLMTVEKSMLEVIRPRLSKGINSQRKYDYHYESTSLHSGQAHKQSVTNIRCRRV